MFVLSYLLEVGEQITPVPAIITQIAPSIIIHLGP
jgi:hypothetical protein